MGFPRQELAGVGLLPLRDLLTHPGTEPSSPTAPALHEDCFTAELLGKSNGGWEGGE